MRRPARRATKAVKDGPDPGCTLCRGKGAYPPEEQNGLVGVVAHCGRPKRPVPCRMCHAKKEQE